MPASRQHRRHSFFLATALLLLPVQPMSSAKPFDSNRDPQQDLLAAEQQAAREHKMILLDFGGNWCPPCLELNAALSEDPALRHKLQAGFVEVRVAVPIFGLGRSKALREHLPRFTSYPHVMVLRPDGTVLHDEVRGDFMTNKDGKGFDHAVLGAFLDRWSTGA